MGQFNGDKELPGVNINSLLNLHKIPSMQELQGHGGQTQMLSSPEFDPGSSHDDFLEQMLASVPASDSAAFNWGEDQPEMGLGNLEQPGERMRPEQITNGTVLASRLMLQQQLLLARGIAGGEDQNDVVDANNSFRSANGQNDASNKDMFNGFHGSLGQNSIPSQHFHHTQGGSLQQSSNFGTPAAMNQPAVSGSSSGGAAAQPRQRVRARRGQATDPHSIAERLRRERIAERMKSLQELVPNANKTDKASMLDEIIDYVKFLQLQVKVLSMSRLGGAAAVAPLVADKSREGRSVNGMQPASSSNNDGGLTVTEQQVAKLMEEDMGAAMQYLQGKGLCLMPISLATAISTATVTSNNRHLLLNGEAGPSSPSVSALTVQSATAANGGEVSLKDAAAS